MIPGRTGPIVPHTTPSSSGPESVPESTPFERPEGGQRTASQVKSTLSAADTAKMTAAGTIGSPPAGLGVLKLISRFIAPHKEEDPELRAATDKLVATIRTQQGNSVAHAAETILHNAQRAAMDAHMGTQDALSMCETAFVIFTDYINSARAGGTSPRANIQSAKAAVEVAVKTFLNVNAAAQELNMSPEDTASAAQAAAKTASAAFQRAYLIGIDAHERPGAAITAAKEAANAIAAKFSEEYVDAITTGAQTPPPAVIEEFAADFDDLLAAQDTAKPQSPSDKASKAAAQVSEKICETYKSLLNGRVSSLTAINAAIAAYAPAEQATNNAIANAPQCATLPESDLTRLSTFAFDAVKDAFCSTYLAILTAHVKPEDAIAAARAIADIAAQAHLVAYFAAAAELGSSILSPYVTAGKTVIAVADLFTTSYGDTLAVQHNHDAAIAAATTRALDCIVKYQAAITAGQSSESAIAGAVAAAS